MSSVPCAAPAVTSSDPTEARRQRGLAIAAVCRIVQKNGHWLVPSQTGRGWHRVTLDPPPFVPECTCPDYAGRGEPCKHVYAVRFVIERESRPEPVETAPATEGAVETPPESEPAPATIPITRAPKRTYRQDWPAYNAAQINEKAKLQALLADLCAGIPEPPYNRKGGQSPVPMADRAFAVVLKVYTTFSGRRASSDMRDARDKGYISTAPHYTSVSRYLEDPAMTPILHRLIAESARPLASVEIDFAADSSGFTSSRFIRWFGAKYGQPKQEYDWVKCSVMTGVKTNIVAAVSIDERYAGDCPKFIPLLGATVGGGFTIREVSADTAYSSYENLEAVAAIGATPFIAFKANANPSRPGTYDRMFHYFNLRRDEFLAHYHKRSNVESTFSMLKAKFGDHLRSKTDTAMANEALCKVLCHNVCVLIQAHYELGIAASFWREKACGLLADQDRDAIAINSIECFNWI